MLYIIRNTRLLLRRNIRTNTDNYGVTSYIVVKRIIEKNLFDDDFIPELHTELRQGEFPTTFRGIREMDTQLIKQLRQLKLAGIIIIKTLDVRNQEAVKSNLSYVEFLELLIEDEITNRKDNAYKKKFYKAHFPYTKTLEEFNFTFQEKLDKRVIFDLATCNFIHKKENIVFVGPPGVGKRYLSIAIGLKVVAQNFNVIFTTISNMLLDIITGKADGTFYQKLKYYINCDLLILDELGYKKLNPNIVDEFFEIISRRYEKSFTIITSNKSFKE